jgi:hypothetical protein
MPFVSKPFDRSSVAVVNKRLHSEPVMSEMAMLRQQSHTAGWHNLDVPNDDSTNSGV